MNDHINWVREVLERQRHWQEQMNVLEPQWRLHEHIREIIEPQERWAAEIERLTAPTRHVLEQIDRFLGPQRELREQMQKLVESEPCIDKILQQFQKPVLEWQQQARRFIESQLPYQRMIESALEPQRQLREQLGQLFESNRSGWLAEAQKQWETLARSYLSGFDPASISVGPSGEIVFHNDTIASEEITEKLGLLAETLAEAPTPLEFLRRLTSFLNGLKSPLANLMLFVVLPYVISILANLTTPLYEEWWKHLRGRPRGEVTMTIREVALETYDPLQLQDYRFVTAKRLRVRSGSNRQHKTIDELPLGKVVKVVQMEKHFCRIEYFDEAQQKKSEGWVATSYLAKFTK